MNKYAEKTLDAAAGGFGTSPEVDQASRWLTRDLDAVESKLREIESDKETSGDKKASFLESWASKIENVGNHHTQNIEASLIKRQAEQDARRAEPVPAHVALLMANSLHNADFTNRQAIVSSDERYIDLLNDTPAAALGMKADERDKLIDSAKLFLDGPEGISSSSQFEADRECFNGLKKRRESLAAKARKLASKNKTAPAVVAKQSKLYSFD